MVTPDSTERLHRARQTLAAVAGELRQGFSHDAQPLLSQLTAASDQLELLETSAALTGQGGELLAQARELRREAALLVEELDRRRRVLVDWRDAMGRFKGYPTRSRA